jgi:hypothetical protein
LYSQTNSTMVQQQSERIAGLSTQLRWRSEPERQRYLANKDEMTERVFREVDGFIN